MSPLLPQCLCYKIKCVCGTTKYPKLSSRAAASSDFDDQLVNYYLNSYKEFMKTVIKIPFTFS